MASSHFKFICLGINCSYDLIEAILIHFLVNGGDEPLNVREVGLLCQHFVILRFANLSVQGLSDWLFACFVTQLLFEELKFAIQVLFKPSQVSRSYTGPWDFYLPLSIYSQLELSHFLHHSLILSILLDVALHLIEPDFLLEKVADLRLVYFGIKKSLDIVEAGPMLQSLCDFCHRLLHVIQVSLGAQLRPQLVRNIVNIGLGWQDLFNVSDALILNFESMVDTSEG